MKNSRFGLTESLLLSAVCGAGILYVVHKNKHLKKELEAAKEINESSKEEYHIKKCEEEKEKYKQIREEANDILNDKQKEVDIHIYGNGLHLFLGADGEMTAEIIGNKLHKKLHHLK